MKLHSPGFESRLKRAVRAALKHSPDLLRESRRTNRARHYSAKPMLRPALSGILALLVWLVVSKSTHTTTGLALIGIWLFAWIFFHVQGLAAQLYASPDLAAFSLLPVEGQFVFRWQFRRFLLNASWSLLDLIGAFLVLALVENMPAVRALVLIPIATLSWLTLLALVGLAILYCPRIPYQLITSAIVIVCFVVGLARSLIAPFLFGLLDRHAETLLILLPTAWTVALFQLALPGTSWLLLLFLIPAAALIWTIPRSLHRLKANYEFVEVLEPEAHDMLPHTEAISGDGNNNHLSPIRAGMSVIEDFIISRGFLVGSGKPPGWMEGWLWKWMTNREKVLMEFTFPGGFELTRHWKKIFRNMLAGVAMSLGLGLVSPTLKLWTISLAILFCFFQVLTRLYTTGRAFQQMFCSGVNIQMYAAYPIGYSELSRMLLKSSLVQLPLLVVCLAACGSMGAFLANWSPVLGLVTGIKLAALLPAARLGFLALAFSSGTNDSSRLRLNTIALVSSILVLGCLFLGLGAGSLLLSDQWLGHGLWVGALLVAWLFWFVYGRFYNANRFDIMSVPKQSV